MVPEDVRAELIDGRFYRMDSPTMTHQLISFEIHSAIARYIRKKGGRCVPFSAPVDVQLCRDDKTIVEPDVLVAAALFCSKSSFIPLLKDLYCC